MPDFEERRWRSADGLRLFARDYAGAGGPARLPIICVHGLTRNSKDFEEVAPLLAVGGRRVLVPDMRGRGQSDRDPNFANYQPRAYARDVLALIDQLGIARAIFIGTSMGGIITMAIAALRSRAVAGAILNDVGPAIAPEGLARIMSYVGKRGPIESWDDAVAYVRRTNEVAFPHYGEEEWRRFAERTFRAGEKGPELDYDPAIALALRKPPPRWTALAAWLMFRRLAKRRPTLLIRGAASDIVSADIAARMKSRCPSLEVVEVPGIGHAPTLSEPEARVAIDNFLARVP